MPSVKDMLAIKTLPGFSPAEPTIAKTPPILPTGVAPGANPYRRCPLPPFNATPDTLRQFDQLGGVPARRVIPLPPPVGGAGSSVTNVTNVTSAPSNSSSSGSTSLASASVAFTAPSLAPGQTYTTTIQVAKSFQLLMLNASNPVEVRLYGTALSRTIDIARSTDTAPPFEVTSGLITDVIFDTSPFQWSWQNRIAANADSPQTSTIYVTVVNYGSGGLGATNVSLTYLPLES